ncbi:deleted in malignant brain tumors 1 protein-like [Anabas testudineus]|uniref:deleted in malignant brain tumors 1 protein-like n=1 Tax=Anabas testudineus TaxID=64144 RepID=UPI000E463C40|nr:deleted in malignant brain tumors 1 protein-like [Anabas testudineus]
MGITQQQRSIFCFFIVSFIFTASSPAAEDHIKVAGTGSTQCSGRVEIYHNNIWGTVCDDEWDLNDAAVVCRELNCGAALSAPTSALFGEGSDQIWLNKVACSGNERSLAECEHGGFAKHNCDHSEDAGVVCSGVPIRLVGSTLLSGRVEIYYNNIWGTACDNGWDLNDASVVCRELGYGAALGAFSLASSGEDTGQIWLDDVDCSGNESSLTECQHNGFGKHNCRHSKDAGVVCSGVPIQLAGPTYCSGRVEVYNKTWGTVCGTSWDLNDASVVCRELGCGVAKKALQSFQFGNKPGQTWLYDVTCSGNESSLTQCQYSGFGNNNCSPAGVTCSAKLPKPSIYIHPAGEVTLGQNISIICSISTPTLQLLHGTFTLNQISGSFSQNQTSKTNCATFTIIKVNSHNEGLYSCRFFQGPQDFAVSDSVGLSVVDKKVPLWLLVSSGAAGILLLLLVLLVVCVVHRRRQKSKQPGIQMTVNGLYENEEDEEEMDYVNVEPMVMKNRHRDQAGGRNEERDGRDHEEAEAENNEDEICDDENDYVNVTQPFYQQVVEDEEDEGRR